MCKRLILGLVVYAGSWAAPVVASNWSQYGGEGAQQYTPLTQVNVQNVQQLQELWRFRTGDLGQDFKRKGHSMQANPVLWNRTLYISTSANWVIAVDAVTGAEKWRFDAQLPKDISYSESGSRGVSLWHGKADQCPNRVLFGTLVGELIALDATTGELCSDFGVAGRIDLSKGVGQVELGDYSVTSPPAVLGDRIIVGSAIGDNRATDLERGIVRALDARSGEILWLWDPIPKSPEDPATATWQANSNVSTGAANVWAPIVADSTSGLVFASTSSPSPDFYGGERLGDNHYANSVVALDSVTGDVVWFRQLVHHDVWDYDIPAQPTLTTISRDGKSYDAVVVVTKTGMLFAFERSTGEPIYAIEERPVPQTDVPGEVTSPTQPFSSIPALADQSALTKDDAFGLLFFDKRSCKKQIGSYRSEGIFTPPSLGGTIMNPGYAGGANWGGVAVDSKRQIAVTNVIQGPALVRLIPRDQLSALQESGDLEGWDIAEQRGTPYYMARRIFLSPIGLPCTKPPWGKLVAVDLDAGDILWETPLGSTKNLAPKAVPNLNWGVPNLGGAMLTGSGLIVIGAAAEHTLRIFQTETGEQIWSTDLPAAAMSTPMSYELDGKQYIAVVAGGHDQLGMQRGDYLLVYGLP
jgi:quinoprotein glucose dehydrogenase